MHYRGEVWLKGHLPTAVGERRRTVRSVRIFAR
jgi:hypothetical protein